MYIRFFFCAVALLPLACSVAAQDAAPAQPGFFHRMAAAAKAGVNDVVNPGKSSEAMYTVTAPGAVPFKGLFNGTARTGFSQHLGWPRAAITFDRYGRKEPCWAGHVVIWSNEHTSSTERFTLCATPAIVVTDATGRAASFDPHSAMAIGRGMLNQSAPDSANTGANRTNGPTPPLHPFKLLLQAYSLDQSASMAAANGMGGHVNTNSLDDRYVDALTRLAVVSGYAQADDFSSSVSFIVDARMWVAGFDPAGNQDR